MMNIAFCYESVMPGRGGCETYIVDLARRLVADRHQVHLYACNWDEASLPAPIQFHRLPRPRGPRFHRPWQFARSCEQALEGAGHDVSIGFNKTWGQDILYPQAGLHVANFEHGLARFRNPGLRRLAWLAKQLDLAHWSFTRLERRQYLAPRRAQIIVNSRMVARHFEHYYGIERSRLFVVPNAIDPGRFSEHDRLHRRKRWRREWDLGQDETVALFLAMNYRLKGLGPLLHAVRLMPSDKPFRLLVAGHPRTAGYEKLARDLGVADRVRFVGFCPDSRNCYFASDFLVHPTFYDPCSLVVLEALACGLPIITSTSNGAGEFLNPPQQGYVIDDPHDDARLAWCMTQMLDPIQRGICALAARQTAARWTFEHHYQQLLSIFGQVSEGKRAA